MRDKSGKFFDIEKKRVELAKDKNYKALLSTYKKGLPDLENLNTGKLWDELNKKAYRSKQSNPMLSHRIKIISRVIPCEVNKILDLGFGSGILERELERLDRDLEIFGSDISQNSVEDASKRFPHWSFSVGDATSIKFPNNFFDCVIALEVLEHIASFSLFKVLREVNRVLKKNGFFIVSVPLNEDLKAMLEKGMNPNAHMRAYQPELLKAELEIGGFKILKEKILYAFHRFYKLKSFISKVLLKSKKPNNIIVIAQKK